MQINEEHTVNIEKLSNLGTGIAKLDGMVVFVENACPGDELRVKLTKLNKNYATAKIVEIITPSKFRVDPLCPLQKVCGACQIQFIDYEYQLKLKKEMVKDALHSIAGLEIDVPLTIPTPKTKEFRQKIQYPVSRTKVSKRILAGYYKPQTHEIVNIKYCPIQPRICDEIIEYIRVKAFDYGISGYNEKKHVGDLRHIVLRSSADTGKVLVTLVANAKKTFERIEDFAKDIFENFDEVCGVCVNLNPKKSNVILSQDTVCVCGEDFVEERVLDKVFPIGANTFFQVNPKSAENIFNYVKTEISKTPNATVLDTYAGIAVFGILVADIAESVVSVEENSESVNKARSVIKKYKLSNIKVFEDDTAKFLQNLKRKFDITILDPPRKGCTQDALDEVVAHTKQKIIYVSCNPATLARDLRYLTAKGWTLKSVQPFDMFCHTFHVETVAVLEL